MIGPTDGNLYALRQREAEQEEYDRAHMMQDCPDCNGTGEVEVLVTGADYGDPFAIYDLDPCPLCNGTGEIPTYDEEE